MGGWLTFIVQKLLGVRKDFFAQMLLDVTGAVLVLDVAGRVNRVATTNMYFVGFAGRMCIVLYQGLPEAHQLGLHLCAGD